MNHVALPPQRLNIISLCTGGGGLDLGIELAMPNAHPVVLVEREAFAVAHLVAAIERGLLAEAAIWSDVRTFDGRPFRGLVDGLIGGIPCQPHSLAGKRLGEEDERDLWSAARRIIVHARPWFVVIENVEGMLSSGGAARVVRDLRKLGFTVEIGLFSATEAGASHQRNRVFIVAVADDANGRWRAGQSAQRRHGFKIADRGCGGELADAAGSRCDGRQDAGASRGNARGDGCGGAQSQRDGGELADADDARLESYGQSGQRSRELPAGPCGAADGGILGLFPPGPADLGSWAAILERSPQLEPAVRRLADGMATGIYGCRIEQLRMLGNGVVPLQAAYAFRTLVSRLAASGSARAAQLVRMMEQVT